MKLRTSLESYIYMCGMTSRSIGVRRTTVFLAVTREKKNGLHASGRYNSGYRHWIEGCLRHGAKLYIGKLDADALDCMDEIENYLIHTHGHVMNTKVIVPQRNLSISHSGDVPSFMK